MTAVSDYPVWDEQPVDAPATTELPLELPTALEHTTPGVVRHEPEVLHLVPQADAERLIGRIDEELAALTNELAAALEAARAAEERTLDLRDEHPDLVRSADDRMTSMIDALLEDAERQAVLVLEDARDHAARILSPAQATSDQVEGSAPRVRPRRTTPLVAAPAERQTRNLGAYVLTAAQIALWAMVGVAIVLLGLALVG